METINYGNTATIYTPSIAKIITNELNDVFKVEDVSDLKTSIETNGLKVPLTVVKDNENYRLISGHRRLKAIKEIFAEGKKIKFGNKEYDGLVPCMFENAYENEDDEFLNLVANNIQRKKTPEEIAAVVRRGKEIYDRKLESGEIVKNDVPAREIIGKMVGVSGRTVDKYLKEDKEITDKTAKVKNCKTVIKNIEKSIEIVREIEIDEYGKTDRQLIIETINELIAKCKKIK